MKTGALILLLSLICWPSIGQIIFTSVENDVNDNNPYKNYLYHSASGNSAKQAGLLVFLHGGAGIDEGFNQLFKFNEGVPRAFRDTEVFNPYADDFYVVIPNHFKGDKGYLDDSREWEADEIDDYISYMITFFNGNPNTPTVDANRIVVFGFSQGGKGAWDYAQKHGSRAAGIMPMWGSPLPNGELGDYCDLQDIPIWSINGRNDTVFPADGTSFLGRDGVNLFHEELMSCGGSNKYTNTIILGRPHDGWHQVYEGKSGYPIYEWLTMMDKTRSTYPPLINLGPDRVILESEDQWVIHPNIMDPLNLDLIITYEVYENGVLNNNLIYDRTDEYIITRGFKAGNTYTIKVIADNTTTSPSSDEMILTVKSSVDRNISSYYIENGSEDIFPQNEDRLDFRQISDQFNVFATATGNLLGTEKIRGELNENFFHNEGLATTYDYEDGLVFNDKLGLYRGTGTRRETYTMSMFPSNEINDVSAIPIISTQFSVWFSDDPDFLPITLLSFNGTVRKEGIEIQWTTTEEIDNSHFELFRGPSREALVKVGDIEKAPQGNLYNYYQFFDQEATSGTHYYQLHSVDLDRSRQLSDIIRVDYKPVEKLVAYPNPAMDGQFIIRYPNENFQQPSLYNSHGQQVSFDLEPVQNSGEQKISIHNPQPGVYLLQLLDKGSPVSLKVIVE